MQYIRLLNLFKRLFGKKTELINTEETPETIKLNHIDAVNQEMMRHAKTIYELDKQYITKIAKYEEDELRRKLKQDNGGL